MDNTKAVTIESAGLASQQFTLKLIPIEKPKRVMKALKALFILWACAGFAVFIPMLHFILVPGLFFAGIFFAISGYTDDVRVAAQDLSCLKCSKKLSLAERADQFPIWIKCETCAIEMKIDSVKN